MNPEHREVISMVAASSVFSHFMDPANRGPSWTPADMLTPISDLVQKLAKEKSVPEEFWLPMVTAAFEFYREFLEPTVNRDYNRIWRK